MKRLDRSAKKDYDYKKLSTTGREGAERASGSHQGVVDEIQVPEGNQTQTLVEGTTPDQSLINKHSTTVHVPAESIQVGEGQSPSSIGEDQSPNQLGEDQSLNQIEEDPTQSQLEEANQTMAAEITRLQAEELTIAEDAEDYMSENEIVSIGNNIHDHDDICRRIEEFRSLYRGKHNQLKSVMENEAYINKYAEEYDATIKKIKEYIKSLKEQRKNLRDKEENKTKKESDVQETKFKFLEKETSDTIKRIDTIFSIDEEEWKDESDSDIMKRKNVISKQVEELNSLPKKIQDTIETSACVANSSSKISQLELKYTKLLSIKDKHVTRLQTEVISQKLDEQNKS